LNSPNGQWQTARHDRNALEKSQAKVGERFKIGNAKIAVGSV
jgi:hypothetical protein